MTRIHVLRVGHRPVRDDRVSTHIGLVARAFGADTMYISDLDREIKDSLDKVTATWGGSFKVVDINSWLGAIKLWKEQGGIVIHLTMYGICVDNVIDELINSGKDVLVIIGAGKMPRAVFSISDYNVAIGNQPHSEIAALALFLDKYFKGEEFKRKFNDYKLRVIPTKNGKSVEVVN